MRDADRTSEFVAFVREHRVDLMRTAALLCAGDEGFAEDVVSSALTTPAYTFGLAPKGWSLQGQNPYVVVFAPDNGATSGDIDDFEGKLVVMFDRNPLFGRPTTFSGRSYWISADSSYTTISTRTRPTEPTGVLRVQYPDDAGWSRSTMLAFLGSVHVHSGARPGRG